MTKQTLIFVATIIVLTTTVRGQSFERYPSFPLQISALEWNLVIEPTLDGFSSVATYQMRSNRNGVLSLHLAQRDLMVESVTLGGEQLPFVTTPDSLKISFRNPLNRGDDVTIKITYKAFPTFGYFMDPSALVWTSGLHGVVPGLLPVIEHPRVRFRTDVTISHPSIIQVITNGAYISRTVMSVSEARTVFRSRTPIPASSIRLALGMMQSSEIRLGSVPLRMYVGDQTRVTDGGKALLALASSEMQRMSNQLKSPYPYESLHILVASTSYGEAWGDGAGMMVLFDDLGDLENQLRISIASQWFRHALQSTDAQMWYPLSSYARILARVDAPALNSDVATLSGLDRSTDLQSILVHTERKTDLAAFMPADLDYFNRYVPGMISREDLTEIRYASEWMVSDLPEAPVIDRPEAKVGGAKASGGFFVRFERTENPEIIRLTIDPYGYPESTDYLMSLTEIYLNDTESQTVRFDQTGGEVELQVGNGLLNLLPAMAGAVPIRTEKPLGFWLHQFRNAPDRISKVEASRALGAFAGDPDFGLLIQDLERNEQDKAVKAALTLGMMESGVLSLTAASVASLMELAEPDIRIALLEVVEKQKDPVVGSDYLLARYAVPGTTVPERLVLARILSRTMPSDEFGTFIQSESKKTDGKELLNVLLNARFSDGSVDEGIRLAEVLIGREYPYSVRRDALLMLDRHDNDTQRWASRLPRMSSDQDPRMRLMALERLGRLDPDQAGILLQDRGSKEADPRIKARIKALRR